MADPQKPKWDEFSPEYLAYNLAGHIGDRPDNKYENCLQVQYDKLYNDYKYVYKRDPSDKVMDEIRSMAVKNCKKLEHIDRAEMDAWVLKNKDKIKRDPVSCKQAVDDILNDAKWKRRVSKDQTQQN